MAWIKPDPADLAPLTEAEMQRRRREARRRMFASGITTEKTERCRATRSTAQPPAVPESTPDQEKRVPRPQPKAEPLTAGEVRKVGRILVFVANKYFVAPREILETARRGDTELVQARHISYYLMDYFVPGKPAQIARVVQRKPSTVTGAIYGIKNKMERNETFKKKIESYIDALVEEFMTPP